MFQKFRGTCVRCEILSRPPAAGLLLGSGAIRCSFWTSQNPLQRLGGAEVTRHFRVNGQLVGPSQNTPYTKMITYTC